MCDIYDHQCIVCGKSVNMHLGDYNTGRDEVAVFHKECFEKAHKMFSTSACAYPVPDDGDVVVVSLTKNALDNEDENHPNW